MMPEPGEGRWESIASGVTPYTQQVSRSASTDKGQDNDGRTMMVWLDVNGFRAPPHRRLERRDKVINGLSPLATLSSNLCGLTYPKPRGACSLVTSKDQQANRPHLAPVLNRAFVALGRMPFANKQTPQNSFETLLPVHCPIPPLSSRILHLEGSGRI